MTFCPQPRRHRGLAYSSPSSGCLYGSGVAGEVGVRGDPRHLLVALPCLPQQILDVRRSPAPASATKATWGELDARSVCRPATGSDRWPTRASRSGLLLGLVAHHREDRGLLQVAGHADVGDRHETEARILIRRSSISATMTWIRSASRRARCSFIPSPRHSRICVRHRRTAHAVRWPATARTGPAHPGGGHVRGYHRHPELRAPGEVEVPRLAAATAYSCVQVADQWSHHGTLLLQAAESAGADPPTGSRRTAGPLARLLPHLEGLMTSSTLMSLNDPSPIPHRSPPDLGRVVPKRLSDSMVRLSATTTPSRMTRALALRRITPNAPDIPRCCRPCWTGKCRGSRRGRVRPPRRSA